LEALVNRRYTFVSCSFSHFNCGVHTTVMVY